MVPVLSRRALFGHAGVLGLSLTGMTAASPRSVLAAPTVTVAAPRIMRMVGCLAPVAVAVTLADVIPGVRYEVFGDIMEADEPDGEDDFCCRLNPQATVPEEHQPSTLLTREVMATDLGLQRGIGPANDETDNPERIQLFARVWVRDLTSGIRFGPWESTRRIIVASPRLLWTRRETLPGSELMTPHGEPSSSSRESFRLPLPPQACIP